MSNVNTNVNTDKEIVNTDKNKEKWIQIRVKEATKQRIKEYVLNSDYKNVSQLFLDSVLTKINGVVLTNGENVNTNVLTNEIRILKDGLLEINKLMEFNQKQLKLPNNLNINKIREAIKRCL